jgi:hypothetical protein
MRATHQLIGCVLCIAGIGAAAATSVGAQGLDSSARSVIDSPGQHDSSGNGGDVAGPTHDRTPASSDSSGNTSSKGNDHSGGASAPASPRRPHLGWQSLLPGSIQ